MSAGADASAFYRDGWYDFSDASLKAAYLRFAEAIAKGHIVVADQYSNTQVMTGETPAGMGSSAGILYYNDTVTYPDNTSEPMRLRVCPMPYVDSARRVDTQAGVGLCAVKSDERESRGGFRLCPLAHGGRAKSGFRRRDGLYARDRRCVRRA